MIGFTEFYCVAILLVLMIFGFCVGTAIIIKIGLMWLEQKKSEPAPVESAEPKIYLVKQTAASPKPKPKKRRSPKVAFEGLILKPEKKKKRLIFLKFEVFIDIFRKNVLY